MTYQEQLKHPKWQKKRLEVMESCNFECQSCGNKDDTLNIHHRIYRKGKKAWEYNNIEFNCLCESCHKDYQDRQDRLKEIIVLLDEGDIENLIGYAKAILSTHGPYEYKLSNAEEIGGASDFFRINDSVPLHSPPGYPYLDINELYKLARFIHGDRFHRRRG